MLVLIDGTTAAVKIRALGLGKTFHCDSGKIF
jgi:hypothetical protein